MGKYEDGRALGNELTDSSSVQNCVYNKRESQALLTDWEEQEVTVPSETKASTEVVGNCFLEMVQTPQGCLTISNVFNCGK